MAIPQPPKVSPPEDLEAGIPVDLGSPIPGRQDFAYPIGQPEWIASTFGPRWKISEERNDFHRGIDYIAKMGTPVFSVGEGEVFRVFPEGSAVYPNGGNTLIIQYLLDQPFCWENGIEVERMYGVYLHLDTIDVEPGQRVGRGEVVAAVGNSGTTEFPHLHFETRLQTNCSLEFQTRHPEKSCATYGFDPHVHPFLFIREKRADRLEFWALADNPAIIHCRSPRGDIGVNRIEADGNVLDFNRRTGIDATLTRKLDHMDYGWVHLDPVYFGGRSEFIDYRFVFPTPPSYVQITDIHGTGLHRELR